MGGAQGAAVHENSLCGELQQQDENTRGYLSKQGRPYAPRQHSCVCACVIPCVCGGVGGGVRVFERERAPDFQLSAPT
eukprot:99052-Pleurochrysis_carterae.AAC.1